MGGIAGAKEVRVLVVELQCVQNKDQEIHRSKSGPGCEDESLCANSYSEG